MVIRERRFISNILLVSMILCSVLTNSGCTAATSENKALSSKALPAARVEKMTMNSESLHKDMKLQVYLPAGYTETVDYPVLYLLHGRGGNEKTWNKDMSLSDKATQLIKLQKIKPLIIVMPQYDNSYGTNYADQTYSKDGRQYGRYEDYLTKDLIGYVDSHYSTIADREGRYIGGLSMGGFAALFLAFTHPDLFSKSGGHSPAMFMDSTEKLGWLFKDEEMRKQTDPLYLVDQLELKNLKVYLDYGNKDMMHVINSTDQLYAKLKAKGIDVQFHTSSGGHDRNYWKANTDQYLMFYAGF